MITDVGLPGISGRQLAKTARALRPQLKVLFATGYGERIASGGESLEPGTAVLAKPFDIDTLATQVRKLLSLS